MANRENASGLKFLTALAPKAATTDNTAYVSEVADLQGYDSCTFVWGAGSIADADVTFTLLVEESDTSGSGYTAVADADLTVTEASAAPTFGSDNSTGKIGYLGAKRYVRVTITPAANSGNIFLAGQWVLGHASQQPVA
jgi:hypothetical protein